MNGTFAGVTIPCKIRRKILHWTFFLGTLPRQHHGDILKQKFQLLFQYNTINQPKSLPGWVFFFLIIKKKEKPQKEKDNRDSSNSNPETTSTLWLVLAATASITFNSRYFDTTNGVILEIVSIVQNNYFQSHIMINDRCMTQILQLNLIALKTLNSKTLKNIY